LHNNLTPLPAEATLSTIVERVQASHPMTIINTVHNKEKRRLLRKNQTPEEKVVWDILRGSKTGLKWRRQVSIGGYVADFYCYKKKLVIELDGVQHQELDAIEYDYIRDAYMKSLGITVIRISNQDIRADKTLSTIVERVVRAANRVRY
jgi:very-short-patch-repair endonuclease